MRSLSDGCQNPWDQKPPTRKCEIRTIVKVIISCLWGRTAYKVYSIQCFPGESLEDFWFTPSAPHIKYNSTGGPPTINNAIWNRQGWYKRQNFCLNWESPRTSSSRLSTLSTNSTAAQYDDLSQTLCGSGATCQLIQSLDHTHAE